jgi:hypothetical protein
LTSSLVSRRRFVSNNAKDGTWRSPAGCAVLDKRELSVSLREEGVSDLATEFPQLIPGQG